MARTAESTSLYSPPMRLGALSLSSLLLVACGGGGSPAPDLGPSPDAGPPVACGSAPTFTGEATYYTFADGSGNCGFPATPMDLMVAAMNAPQYAGAVYCGACVHITGPSGEVTVRVVDQCPECPMGNLDLSPEAFDHIAARALGRVPITWHEVPCDVTGPVDYHFKDGSNQWWTAIQLRNHRHRAATLEAMTSTGWQSIPRLDYNYFVAPSGLGAGPLTLRVTDIHGDVITDDGVPQLADADHASASQFPACR